MIKHVKFTFGMTVVNTTENGSNTGAATGSAPGTVHVREELLEEDKLREFLAWLLVNSVRLTLNEALGEEVHKDKSRVIEG